jgi:hypothetical protein
VVGAVLVAGDLHLSLAQRVDDGLGQLLGVGRRRRGLGKDLPAFRAPERRRGTGRPGSGNSGVELARSPDE